MSTASNPGEVREVPAVHGRRRTLADPPFETAIAEGLWSLYQHSELAELYARFALGDDRLHILMRKAIFNGLAKSCGAGLRVDSGVSFRHLETFAIGSDVFIGTQAVLQGRFDGTCTIGSNSWIGPQAFLDARNLTLGTHVGIGPGAKILGSQHTGMPVEAPVIETGLIVKPIVIDDWADVGINAVVLPGVTVGKGAIVGAGAVVTADVAPFSIAAGVPARFVRWRKDSELHAIE